MKFLYEYRTKDNVRHDGTVDAATRDAAFALLKSRGVRPSRLVEAPGFFNRLFGKGKRWLAIAALLALALGLMAFSLFTKEQLVEMSATFDSTMRRQIIGDSAIVEKGVKTGWADVFDDPGDRFLASYAIPGTVPAVLTVDDDALRRALASVAPTKDASLETRQILAIVSGLKADISSRLRDGWTLAEIRKALFNRQRQEIEYYNRARNEIEQLKKNASAARLESLWEERNRALRAMGIKPVPVPE